jgi:hypothetical protein
MVPTDWNALADLHRLEQMQSEPRHSPRYLEGRDGTLASLVNQVMAKNIADRQRYSIMVGEKVFNAAAIEALFKQDDFPDRKLHALR